jgi:hypothetical protein
MIVLEARRSSARAPKGRHQPRNEPGCGPAEQLQLALVQPNSPAQRAAVDLHASKREELEPGVTFGAAPLLLRLGASLLGSGGPGVLLQPVPGLHALAHGFLVLQSSVFGAGSLIHGWLLCFKVALVNL